MMNRIPGENTKIKSMKIFQSKVDLLPRSPALTPSYESILSLSTIGGGRVSFSIGGRVTGSTPQKSSVNRADEKYIIKIN